MQRHNSVSCLALALVVVVGLAAPAAAGEQVPFKGSLEGAVTRSLPPPPIAVNVEAVGTATHLGRFTLEIPHVVTPPNGEGVYHFVAANGDQLTATFKGVSAPAGPGFLHIVETATIIGGTGRFAGATGGFICDRLYDIDAGVTIGAFKGTISMP